MSNRVDWSILILALILIPIAIFMVGYKQAQDHWRREAVKHGVAEWQPDEDGNAKFHWKAPQGEDQ